MYEPESDTDKGKTLFENQPESFFSHFTTMDEQHTQILLQHSPCAIMKQHTHKNMLNMLLHVHLLGLFVVQVLKWQM